MAQEIVSPDRAPTAGPIAKLIGQELLQVWFVMDYVELVFDGAKLSCYAWPSVEMGDVTLHFGDRDYRNALCSFIMKTVQDIKVLIERNGNIEQEIWLDFGNREVIRVSLMPDSDEPMEVAAYNDEETSWLIW